MSFLQVDIAAFKTQWADLLAAYPELADDEDLRADVLEGETDAHRLVSMMVRRRREAQALASAGKEIRSDQSERIARFERQADGYAALIKTVMQAADLQKIVLPEATVSITKPRTKVEISDLAAIPQGYAKFEKRADKDAIKAALEAGAQIPGAALVLSEDGLLVRTK